MREPEPPLADPFRPGQLAPVKHDPYNDAVGTLPNTWVLWRDTAYELLKGMPDFNGNVERVFVYPTKDEELPAMRIALTRESMSSEGFWAQAEPHFVHTMTMIVSILAAAGDPAVLDGTVMALAENVKQTLLSDYTWINTAEGIDQFNTTVTYPDATEVPLCEVRMEIVGKLQSRWQPVTPNKFRELFILRRITPTQDDVPGLDEDITTMFEGGTP